MHELDKMLMMKDSKENNKLGVLEDMIGEMERLHQKGENGVEGVGRQKSKRKKGCGLKGESLSLREKSNESL